MVNSVQILHLEKLGYGPTGSLTRLAWREECMNYFKQGNEVFLSWQLSWQAVAEKSKLKADFSINTTSAEGITEENIIDKLSYTLDFSGQSFVYEVVAYNYVFIQDVTFCNATFIDNVWFSSSVFQHNSDFEKSYFF